MADDNSDTSGKRRRPTTIDLKATEVASEPVKPTEAAESKTETARPEASGAAGESAQPDPAKRPAWSASAGAALRERIARHTDWRVVAASAAGAAVVLAILLALGAAGAFDRRDDDALAKRIAQLEQQVRDLANRPQLAPPDMRPVAELSTRVTAAEQAVGKLEAAAAKPSNQADPALAARIGALEATLRPLNDANARLDAATAAARDAKARADAAYEAAQKSGQESQKSATPVPTQKEIDDLTARVATLEQAAKSADARITTTAGADKAGRLAFTAAVLRGAVTRGEPFRRELDAVRPLVPDAKVLGALEPFAPTGVPNAAALSRELSQLSGAMLAATGTPAREGGFIDRLQQGAERLVRIRPISESPGDDPVTVIGRAEVKATHGDLAGARADIASLPAAVQAPAQKWIARVDARDAALAAVRDLAESAIGTLGKP
jgi:hypothetical protein